MTESGITTAIRFVKENAFHPMLTTKSGMSTDVKSRRSARRSPTMFVTEPRPTDARAVLPLNADAPILVTESATEICVRFTQLAKAYGEMVTTESGTETDTNVAQLSKAPVATVLTVSGMSTWPVALGGKRQAPQMGCTRIATHTDVSIVQAAHTVGHGLELRWAQPLIASVVVALHRHIIGAVAFAIGTRSARSIDGTTIE